MRKERSLLKQIEDPFFPSSSSSSCDDAGLSKHTVEAIGNEHHVLVTILPGHQMSPRRWKGMRLCSPPRI